VDIYRFAQGSRQGVAVGAGGELRDLSAYGDLRTIAAIVSSGEEGRAIVQRWADAAPRLVRDDVHLLAPVDDGSRLFCAALNYVDHAAESGRPMYDEPLMFLKLPSNVVGPYDPIDPPPVGTFIDYEGEVAVVIGRPGARIGVDEAMDHVLGWTVLNDVTARDLQRRERDGRLVIDWFSGKALDRSTPVGPSIVTPDQAPAVEDMTIRTWVNGELVQEGSAGEMVFPTATLVAYVSERVALRPLDVIATGTPARLEAYRSRRLTAGDVVEVEVGGVGRQRNVLA
jgi:2-keto-4-pentenoate hydratase/2-oxohepta-3-ene-1,7-dioic acid hydratase in catechol pathway